MTSFYGKKSLSIDNQVKKLKDRGLLFPSLADSKNKSDYIGYYRLSVYCKSFQSSVDVFDQGTTFDDILALYDFDRKLKALLFDALERIEISLKSIITNVMSDNLGPYWIETSDPFIDKFNYLGFLSKVCKSASFDKGVVRSFYQKYKSKKVLPPSWILMEVLNFNDIVKIYRNLQNNKSRMYKREISKKYNLKHQHLDKYLEIFLDIRNICAHHGRLWNIHIKKVPRNFPHQEGNGNIFNAIIISCLFLKILSPSSSFKNRVIALIKDGENNIPVNFLEMGIAKNWEKTLNTL